MIWLLLLLTTPAFAQMDLSAIKELDEELPNYSENIESDEDVLIRRQSRRFRPPTRIISLEEIKGSGTQLGAIQPGVPVRNLETNKNFTITKPMYIRYFNQEDEHGFKYVQNKSGTVTWRILSRYVEPIKEEIALYVPPLRYTPAPDNIIRAEYDKKLHIPPEVSFYAGVVQGDFMKDLFNDNKAKSGLSNQYGLHFFTQWKLPVKAGAVLHYEKASYRLDDGGQVLYDAPSFGPQFKTKEFEIFGQAIRFQTQFRFSPFARASAETTAGKITYRFNSADLLTSIERPIKNRFGEFVLGFYFQSQWLNLKEQSSFVNVKATNETNKSFGLSLSQVFE
jgi:hypothetical protein